MRKDGSAYYPVLEREIILRDLTKKGNAKVLKPRTIQLCIEVEWNATLFTG